MNPHYSESILVSAIRREEDQIQADEKRFTRIIGILFALVFALIAVVFYLLLRSGTNTGPTAVQTEISADISVPDGAPAAFISPTPTTAPISAIAQSASIAPVVSAPAIREYFIPLGTGSNQSGDWMDVPGALATVDFGGYRTIQKIVFEVNVNIPTANQTASVRLFNVTDKHPVWNSELTATNNVYTVSEPLVFDTGSKTYQVQMKTQLQFLAELTQARVHVFLK